MNIYPIYIPSKGRSETCLTTKILASEGISFTLCVEPQDYTDYVSVFGRERVIKTLGNDQGLGVSRNRCKVVSVDRKEAWHWQIDDNVSAFRERKDGKNVISTAAYCLGKAELFISRFKNVGLAALTHVSFAFSRATDVGINKQCSSVVLVNNSLPLWWRQNIVEDTDFSMQVLNHDDQSWCTVVLHRLLFQKPAQNSMGGGMSMLRDKVEYRKEAAEALARAWPGSFTVKVVPDKRLGSKHRVMPSRVWMGFNQRPKLKELAK